jgi:integrase
MFKRGNVWYGRVYLNGKQVWRSLSRDWEIANRKLKKLKGEGPQPSTRTTVAQMVPEWINEYVRTNRNEKGIRLAECRAKAYLIPGLGMKPLVMVRKSHLRGYRLWLEQQQLSNQTVSHILAEARCFFLWCLDSDLIHESPIPRRLLPRLQEQLAKPFLDDEMAILCALPEPYGFTNRLGCGTGLRWSELCRTQASDIQGNELVVSQTKSGKVRRIPLGPEMLKEIRSRVWRLVPFSPSASGSFARTVRRLSGIEGYHAHRMRHTFACNWLLNGGTLHALQQLLGHASVVTTQRYARLTDEGVRQEAMRVHLRLSEA